ncbi:MAG: hypothetical protein ABIP55_07240 [Tepidisphaeraceae bacterium]
MTNKFGGNTIAAFGRNSDGTLTPINEFATGGNGGAFDDGNGLDPLISQNSLVAVDDRFILAVNPGSDSVTSFRINSDFSLTQTSVAPTGGVGPISVAYRDGLVYVANADTDGTFTDPTDQVGNVTGLTLNTSTGQLTPIAGSTRQLANRPSDVRFAPNGGHLVVASVNAGSANLAIGSTDELVVYGVEAGGNLSLAPQGAATSTLPGNAEGRNLPTSIGFEIVERGGNQYVVATEAREFTHDGGGPMLPNFQTGSVSTWLLEGDGSLSPIAQDVLTGPSVDDGPTSACWITFSPDGSTFFVASASGAAISSFSLNEDGTIDLINGLAAVGAPAEPAAPNPLANADGFIDLTTSSDGQYLYQLLGVQGSIEVFELGFDNSLTSLQRTSGLLPETNIQGIVSVSAATTPIPLPPAAWPGLVTMAGIGGAGVIRQWRNKRPLARR